MGNKFPIPENETARLQKLQYYDILDTEAEAMFDDLTKLAAQILKVPISAISLIDENRQWFKSIIGLDARETSRDISFCQYTIMDEDVFEVPDTLIDRRFIDNPLVTGEPEVRFYSGVPLRDNEGITIGSFCIIDRIPRKFNREQQNLLKLLANTALKLIQLRRERIEVEKLSVLKDEFISNMSHEIRTPLNAIIGFNDLLSKTPLNMEQSNYLNTINKASQNLKNIINDILDVSKLDGNKIKLEERPLSIAALVQHIVKLQSPNAKAKKVKLLTSLDHELPQFVYGDETRISQILNNLVSNALKFTEQGYVEIRTLVTSKEIGITNITFEVKDTGIGISSEKKQKIFERFEQAETSTTRLYGGSGLGLNIVKKLVALYGGEIHLESEEGKGSLFSFELQFKDCTEFQPEIETLKVDLTENLFGEHKILLAEDNFHNQLLAKSYFKRWGAEITIAENGKVAIEALLKNDYDIIIMDLQMPVMDGFITTNKIRQELKLNIPIIGCSANSESLEMKKCLAAGMNDYISKPYSEEELIQTTFKNIGLNQLNLAQQEKDNKDYDDFSIVIAHLKNTYGVDMIYDTKEFFLKRTPLDISEIQSALDKKDLLSLKNKAHFIAGTMGALNFQKGVELAKNLEEMARNNQLAKSIDLAEKLILHLKNAITCFEGAKVA